MADIVLDITVEEQNFELTTDIVTNEVTIDVTQVNEETTINVSQFTSGESAYEIALRNGFTGTEQDWLDNMDSSVVDGGLIF